MDPSYELPQSLEEADSWTDEDVKKWLKGEPIEDFDEFIFNISDVTYDVLVPLVVYMTKRGLGKPFSDDGWHYEIEPFLKSVHAAIQDDISRKIFMLALIEASNLQGEDIYPYHAGFEYGMFLKKKESADNILMQL